MDEDVFLAEVQRQTGLATLQEAHEVTRVVLHSLAERLPDGWAHNLAAELPAQIAWPLRHGARTVHAYGTRRQDFVALIAERADADPTDAEGYARAVLGVVARACDPDLLRRVYEPLTSDVLALTGDLLGEADLTRPDLARSDLDGAVSVTA